MKSRYFIFIIVVLFFACNSSQKISEPGIKEKKEEWQSLFDGKTTKGWHKFGGGPARWVGVAGCEGADARDLFGGGPARWICVAVCEGADARDVLGGLKT